MQTQPIEPVVQRFNSFRYFRPKHKTMRILYVLLLTLFSMNLIAQPKNSPYLYDSSLGMAHVLLVEYPGATIFFHKDTVWQDTAGIYKNDIGVEFSFYQKGAIVNREIKLTFDKPVDFC